VYDEQKLREIVKGLEAAWNKGESVAWAEFFSEDADFMHILGGFSNGRTTIERGHRAIFDTIWRGFCARSFWGELRAPGGIEG
jgi:uncharacterized protein (TIGR02246 family)